MKCNYGFYLKQILIKNEKHFEMGQINNICFLTFFLQVQLDSWCNLPSNLWSSYSVVWAEDKKIAIKKVKNRKTLS